MIRTVLRSRRRAIQVSLALVIASVPMVLSAPAFGAEVKKPAITLKTASSKLGNIIVDDKGLSIYMFTVDARNVSRCEGACLTAWPPMMLTKDQTLDDVELGGNLRRSLLGVAMRENGSRHVTYNGYPLYWWFRDAKAGDVSGQWVGDVWFVLSDSGAPVSTRL